MTDPFVRQGEPFCGKGFAPFTLPCQVEAIVRKKRATTMRATMHERTEERALELVAKLMQWELGGQVNWNADISKLEWDSDRSEVVWNVQFSRGGAVRIVDRVFSLEANRVEDLHEVAKTLICLGECAETYCQEQADFEKEIRDATKSLLRRKAARGLRLISVIYQPISTVCRYDVGIDVSIEYDRGTVKGLAILPVWSVENLKEEFDDLLKQLDERSAIAA
jgi:hypothetical protein